MKAWIVDYGIIDWSKTDRQIALEQDVSFQAISQARLRRRKDAAKERNKRIGLGTIT